MGLLRIRIFGVCEFPGLRFLFLKEKEGIAGI